MFIDWILRLYFGSATYIEVQSVLQEKTNTGFSSVSSVVVKGNAKPQIYEKRPRWTPKKEDAVNARNQLKRFVENHLVNLLHSWSIIVGSTGTRATCTWESARSATGHASWHTTCTFATCTVEL